MLLQLWMTTFDIHGHYSYLIKRDIFVAFRKFAKVIQTEKLLIFALICSDHGGEFQND